MNVKDLINMCDSLCGNSIFVIFDNKFPYELGDKEHSIAMLYRDEVISSFGDCLVLRFYLWSSCPRLDILIHSNLS